MLYRSILLLWVSRGRTNSISRHTRPSAGCISPGTEQEEKTSEDSRCKEHVSFILVLPTGFVHDSLQDACQQSVSNVNNSLKRLSTGSTYRSLSAERLRKRSSPAHKAQ
ncbi:hypothetical protein F4804DRAFT_235905 [Jackrogersella minutella]|nr:hypothetical protein F4804DRAFT_235905 [Jackrogersella minutella]